MIEKEYDVIVVGGGPGGAGAAFAAAGKGGNVLLLEKRQEIGAPKRCGEGLSVSAIERMGIEKDDLWVRREIKGVTVYSPDGKSIGADYEGGPEGYVIERKLFDKCLAEKAVMAGAVVMAKTEVTRLLKENGRIVGVEIDHDGKKSEIMAKVVIAADGIESRMAREAGIDTTLKLTDVIAGAQFEMVNLDIDPDRIAMYLGNEIAPGGYLWIFPKSEHVANVGIGVRRPFAKENAIDYLRRFIESEPGLKKGSIIEVNTGGVPVGGIMDNMVADGFIVVGDAAHQVNPIHGGGIGEAWVGGKMAGEIAMEAIEENDLSKKFLSQYNKRWLEKRGNKLKKLVKLREVTESLSDDDMNWLVEYLSGEDLIGFAKSSGLAKLGKILMKRPRLIFLARKLL